MRFKIIVVLALIITLNSLSSNVQAQTGTAANQVKLTFTDLGVNDLGLQGASPSRSFWVPFEPGWLIPKAELDIHYIASPVLSDSRSTLTVTVNGVEMTSIRPQTDNTEHNFQLSIPAKYLTDIGFQLGFSDYAILPASTCLDGKNPALWMTITGASTIILHPAVNTKPPALSDLPDALIAQSTYGKTSPILFVLPDNPDATTLTTASQVAAWLGRVTGSSRPLQAVTVGALKQNQLASANLILIGTRDGLPMLTSGTVLPAPVAKAGYTTSDGKAIPPEKAVIQIFNSPWSNSRKVLLVSAGNAQGLQLAGQTFADKATSETLKKPVEVIGALIPQTNASPQSVWATSSATFDQLGEGTQASRGVGSFDKYYFFRYPPGWQLAPGSQLVLKVAYSPVMNSNASYVAGFINNLPVGSLRTGQGVNDTELTFDLPVGEINRTGTGATQAVNLHLAIANFLSTQICTEDNPSSAWTNILGDSTLSLRHTYVKVPDLQAFPYPFVSDKGDAPTTIILPAQPNSDELTAALEISTMLGRLAPMNFELRMVANDAKVKDAQTDAHLIILGSRDRQPLSDEFAATMFKDIKSSDNAIKQTQGDNIGFWQEGVSPWNKDRIAMLVSGTSGPAFIKTAAQLAQSEPPISSAGLIALVDDTGEVHTILQSPATPTPTPTLMPQQAATSAATP